MYDKLSQILNLLLFLAKKVIIYALLFIAAISFVLWYFPVFHIKGLPQSTMMFAFLTKIFIGLLLIYIHTKTYGEGDLSHDGQTFMNEGKTLNDVFYKSPSYFFQLMFGVEQSLEFAYQTEYWSPGDLTIINDSKNVIRLHAIIHFFSRNNIAIHLSIFCFLALLGVKLLFLSIKRFIKINQHLAFWILLLPPSTIFWTSSLMKESILMLGIGLFAYALLSANSFKIRLIYFLISIPFLIGFKPYVGLFLILALLYILWSKYLFRDQQLLALPIAIISVFLAGLVFHETRDNIVHHLTRKQFDFRNVGRGGLHALSDTCFYYFRPDQYDRLSINNGEVQLLKETDALIMRFGSTQEPIPIHLIPKGEIWKNVYQTPGCESFIEITPINNSAIQLIQNIPEALINALFRPFPNDAGSKLKYIAILEIFGMLLFIAFAFWKRRKLQLPEKRILIYLSIFSVMTLLLIGWTTPVIGAIVRYRFPVQLATVIGLLIILKPLKIKSWKNTY
jgi:hypothetical protein